MDKRIGCRCWNLKYAIFDATSNSYHASFFEKRRKFLSSPHLCLSYQTFFFESYFSGKVSRWNNFRTFCSARFNSHGSKTLDWLLNFKRKQNAITRTLLEKLLNLLQSTIGSWVMFVCWQLRQLQHGHQAPSWLVADTKPIVRMVFESNRSR